MNEAVILHIPLGLASITDNPAFGLKSLEWTAQGCQMQIITAHHYEPNQLTALQNLVLRQTSLRA